MKRSKLLIPTLSCLTIAPTIVTLSSCNKDTTEQKILDAIIKPIDLEKTTVDDFKQAYVDSNAGSKNNELLYDSFGLFNQTIGDAGGDQFNIHDLYVKQHEGAWKINVPEYSVKLDGNQWVATLRGYVSYVFSKQHKATIQSVGYTFNANDYVMITFEFSEVVININTTKFGFTLSPKYGDSLGFYKYKFNSAKHEAIQSIKEIDTTGWKVPNSKNWAVE